MGKKIKIIDENLEKNAFSFLVLKKNDFFPCLLVNALSF